MNDITKNNLNLNYNHETFSFPQKQKRRIHEQDYAMKVVSHTKVDKETIQLSESLFNAKITAKQSSCIIRDISVQQKIKFYDEYLRNSDSFRKQTDRKSLSPDIIKPKCIEQLLQSQNQHVSEQQISTRPINMQTPIKKSNSGQQSRKSSKQYTQSISPTKKQPQNSQRKKIINNSSPQIKPKSNSQYVQQKERQSCYSKLQTKEQEQKEQEIAQNTNRAQTARSIAIAERNEEWKQKLKNKMDNQLKKQKQKEMVDCIEDVIKVLFLLIKQLYNIYKQYMNFLYASIYFLYIQTQNQQLEQWQKILKKCQQRILN